MWIVLVYRNVAPVAALLIEKKVVAPPSAHHFCEDMGSRWLAAHHPTDGR